MTSQPVRCKRVRSYVRCNKKLRFYNLYGVMFKEIIDIITSNNLIRVTR